ncbi:hypothetical protein C0V82_08700 [Niveispirillum cyanobacteriorum]|uniref:Uncharacterized protein n=2 Tax=Niveispirillum cyanobacteriorum TaxID=1612173 RepID=A0A2K9NAY4_9PROT|nr:hypothetical protein C0V82_08700 [Niveispirillum cyanobacteriorum]
MIFELRNSLEATARTFFMYSATPTTLEFKRVGVLLMATPDQIPSDLTLEVAVNLSPERFMAVARAFFGYVEEIGRSITADESGPDWIVRLREGSHLIGVDPAPNTSIEAVHAVYAKAESGIKQLSVGDLTGAGLSDAALKHLRNLADATIIDRTRTVPIRLWVKRAPTELNKEIANLIRDDWNVDYHDFGTIEGKLEAIQDRGALNLTVRDPYLRQTVRCIVSENLLKKAFENFRQRVELSGTIHYRKNGKPISIEVAEITPLEDDTTLPTLNDVRGILRFDA